MRILSRSKNILACVFLVTTLAVGCDSPKKDTSSEPSTSPESPTSPTPTPPENPTPVTTRKMKNLGIFYGWPTAINDVDGTDWDNRLQLASAEIAKYDRMILGETLEDPSHGDHANTKTIIENVHAGTSGTQIFGYVCTGTCGGNNPSSTVINANIDQWKAMEIDGIFLDEAGFDFNQTQTPDANANTRARLVSALNHAHSLGLKVMVNAWNADDIFVAEAGNPAPFIAGDSFLLESYLYQATNDNLSIKVSDQSFNNFRIRVNKALNNKPAGVEIWAVSTTGEAIAAFNPSHWTNLVEMAWADNLTGIGWGAKDFSSSDSMMPFREIPNTLKELRFDSSSTGTDLLTVNVTSSAGEQKTLTPKYSLIP